MFARVLCCALCALLVSPVVATPLLPGESLMPIPQTEFPDGVFFNFITQQMIVPNSIDAVAYSGIVRHSADNPFGGLTFVYLLDHFDGIPIERFVVTGFAGFQTDVNYASWVDGVAPASIDRLDDNTVGWDYFFNDLNSDTGILVNHRADWIIIHTDASSFALHSGTAIGETFVTVWAWGPAVPEPSSLALLALGAVGIVARRRADV